MNIRREFIFFIQIQFSLEGLAEVIENINKILIKRVTLLCLEGKKDRNAKRDQTKDDSLHTLECVGECLTLVVFVKPLAVVTE